MNKNRWFLPLLLTFVVLLISAGCTTSPSKESPIAKTIPIPPDDIAFINQSQLSDHNITVLILQFSNDSASIVSDSDMRKVKEDALQVSAKAQAEYSILSKMGVSENATSIKDNYLNYLTYIGATHQKMADSIVARQNGDIERGKKLWDESGDDLKQALQYYNQTTKSEFDYMAYYVKNTRL